MARCSDYWFYQKYAKKHGEPSPSGFHRQEVSRMIDITRQQGGGKYDGTPKIRFAIT